MKKLLGRTKIFPVYILKLLPSVKHILSAHTNRLCLHQFLETKTTEVNKSLKTDANGAH